MILSVVLSTILIGLGILHWYWAFGGLYGFYKTLPTTKAGKRILNPKKRDSAIVGLGLIVFGLFYLINANVISINKPDGVFKYGSWIIPAMFLLRAIGDFKYVGFFKTIKTTDFAKLDTKWFSPLCLSIAVLGVLIKIIP